MSKKLYTFKEILPNDLFECFRISLMINTGKTEASDKEVEKYIHALVDTSDAHHSYAGQPMNTKPTFTPAA